MARTAAEDGISTIAATPHVNRRYPVRPDAIAREVGRLNVALARMALTLAVLPAAEVALNAIGDLDKTTLRQLTIGGSGCLLVEPPYADRAPFLERILFSLQVQGFRPMLAHPERALAFQDRPERLARVVEGGVLACVNSGSMIGRFGRGSQERALRFLADGLVAVVASDSHDGE